MSSAAPKRFNLPWNQRDHYWVTLYPKERPFSEELIESLHKIGLKKLPGGGMGAQTPRDWKILWDKLHGALKRLDALAGLEVAVTPGAQPPAEYSPSDCKSPEAVRQIADSLWLGEALLEDRLVCYLQPVVSAKDKVFGYESFARAVAADGSVIGGERVIAASRILGIEYMIDRHLHVQAIKTFVSSAFNGFLFVNFFPGFIHRPAVYLEGLSETARNFGIVSKHVVLDFTRCESPHDLAHLKSVCEYGRSRGYSIALDDIMSVEGARRLFAEIHPDFVKLDMALAQKVAEPSSRETIREIVALAHAGGGVVIAEGVETEEMHAALKGLNVDLFQGYLFSPPAPVETALRRSTA